MPMKKELRIIFRILIIVVLLYVLHLNKANYETLAIIGIFFLALIFLKGELWKLSEHILEEHLPFTKKWPDWLEKILLILVMIFLYYLVKTILYFILGLFGIDITEILVQGLMAEQ